MTIKAISLHEFRYNPNRAAQAQDFIPPPLPGRTHRDESRFGLPSLL